MCTLLRFDLHTLLACSRFYSLIVLPHCSYLMTIESPVAVLYADCTTLCDTLHPVPNSAAARAAAIAMMTKPFPYGDKVFVHSQIFFHSIAFDFRFDFFNLSFDHPKLVCLFAFCEFKLNPRLFQLISELDLVHDVFFAIYAIFTPFVSVFQSYLPFLRRFPFSMDASDTRLARPFFACNLLLSIAFECLSLYLYRI